MEKRSKIYDEVAEFIRESNHIEDVRTAEAFEDSMFAWKRLEKVKEFHLSNLIRLHYDIMFRLNKRIAGQMRKCDVSVGGKICPNPGSLRRLVHLWFTDHSWAKDEKGIQAAHVAFEHIHPFEDGNGRTGRIIMNWQRRKYGLPILIIKESEKHQYYDWFNES